jgi:alpha-beta hydrolase superfamily lysophospholipase
MTEFEKKIGSFKSDDGLSIFYRHYPAADERACLVIAHGLGEHSGRYGNVLERLLPKGISVWALDHRGHGKSDGKRGHITSFQEYLNDLHKMIELVKRDLSAGRKCLLLGHSMGGLIVLNYAIRYPDVVDAVIASSPGLGMVIEVPAFKKALGNVMSSVWPGMSMGNELDASKISHDAAAVQAYQADPLVHDRVTARWFTEFMAAMDAPHKNAAGIQVPVLMQVAGDDHLVNAGASRKFFDRLTVDDRTLFVYDGLYHEIYNEPVDMRAKVLADLETWLEKQI